MEEIREAPRCINIVPALGGGFCCSEGNYCTCGGVFKKSGDTALQAMTNQYHTALRRADMWRRRAEAAENKLQHITAPESSPAPLESQEVSQRVAKLILEVRDAIALGDHDLAYHFLYQIASPNFDKADPWKETEEIAEGRKEGDLEK